ncbi:MAG: ribosome recycling factor [Caulobacteraceae bacterium]
MATSEKPELGRYQARMDKAVAALKEEFATLRTGRASASLLDQVHVEAYGSRMPVNQVGAVSVPEPRSINVSVWDKALVVSVEKAIRNSGLGLNPVVEGQNLRIPIPPLSEERRRDLVKLAGKYAEQQRVAVRNVRRDAMDDLKKAEKDATISQDEHRHLEHEVQKLTDEAVKRVDESLKSKEHEIMQV